MWAPVALIPQRKPLWLHLPIEISEKLLYSAAFCKDLHNLFISVNDRSEHYDMLDLIIASGWLGKDDVKLAQLMYLTSSELKQTHVQAFEMACQQFCGVSKSLAHIVWSYMDGVAMSIRDCYTASDIDVKKLPFPEKLDWIDEKCTLETLGKLFHCNRPIPFGFVMFHKQTRILQTLPVPYSCTRCHLVKRRDLLEVSNSDNKLDKILDAISQTLSNETEAGRM